MGNCDVFIKFNLITINCFYRKDFLNETKENRQEYLKNYGFNCDCIACEKNFPMLEDLTKEGPLIEYSNDAYRNVFCLFHENNLTLSIAKKFLQEYLTILNEASKPNLYVIKDYGLLIECLITCLTLIATYGEKIP